MHFWQKFCTVNKSLTGCKIRFFFPYSSDLHGCIFFSTLYYFKKTGQMRPAHQLHILWLLFEQGLPVCVNLDIKKNLNKNKPKLQTEVLYILPGIVITQIFDKAKCLWCLLWWQARQVTSYMRAHTHEYPNIYLLGAEFDWTLRWLSKRADVSSFPLPMAPLNISDTREMGASTPAVTVILGHKAFHLVPTGSTEMLYWNIGMLYTQ